MTDITPSLGKIIPLRPIVTDRTSEEVDELCGMKYWWYRLEGGTGIVPTDESEYLTDGRDIHSDLAMFAQGRSVEEVLAAIPPPTSGGQTDLERHYRRLGWAVAFGLYVEPFLKQFGEEVMCEDEIILDRSPLWVAVTPDRIQRRKGGGLVYREYKSAKTFRREWQDHWLYAIQLHVGLKAAEEELKEKMEYGQVLGLNKGYDRDGRLVHPYAWAYRKGSEWSHEYKWGWDHAPVWEYPNGIVEWVEKGGRELGLKQFCWSTPVMLDERLLDRWVTQRLNRHMDLRQIIPLCQADEGLRAYWFDSRLIHCRPSFGPACPYLAACHNSSVHDNPIGSGLYKIRTPHHEIELLNREE